MNLLPSWTKGIPRWSMARAVFLYTELAGYLLSCLEHYVSSGNSALVIHWPVNPEAPFTIEPIEGVTFLDRTGMDASEIRTKIFDYNPDVILCSGWVDKAYLKALGGLSVNKVLLMDNQWIPSLTKRFKAILVRAVIKPIFTHAWVPGEPQKKYARILGFPSDRIEQGFYTADLSIFNSIAQNRERTGRFPKRLVYLGRYVEHKGITDLWDDFSELSDSFTDWDLFCIGTGDLWDERREHPRIHHLGFKQPEELTDILEQGGVFVLPSHFEPWGVVVQEMAAAGYPMVVSRQVGAASAFCFPENSMLFDTSKEGGLSQALTMIMSLADRELWNMSEESHRIAQQFDHQRWTNTLLELC